ncbi:MAG: glycosyltransferase [Bacteroidales bacterium]|nr:glycosyltransferase [Bacteroidales bacterium]
MQTGTRKNFKKNFSTLYKQTLWYESHLSCFVNTVLTCSEKDASIFQDINRNKINTIVVPNGTDTSLKEFIARLTRNETLIFCGDLNTVANHNGLLWFCARVWPLLKQARAGIKLIVTGGGENNPHFDKFKQDPNIEFKGRVADLKDYYLQARIAIVPLHVGSGTRLKILEAMSYGIPVVSTSLGAEGIECENKTHILIADNATDFSTAIINIFNNNEELESMRKRARKLVEEKYEVAVVKNQQKDLISDIIDNLENLESQEHKIIDLAEHTTTSSHDNTQSQRVD